MAHIFEKPTKLSDGRYFVKMSDTDNKRIFKQLNGCTVVGPGCYKIPVDLSDYDEKILAKAAESSEDWFGKTISLETLTKMYENSVTSDVFEASLMKIKGKCVTLVFNANKEEIPVEELQKGCKCNLIVELSGIWFLKKNFGPIWRVAQARILNSEQKSPVNKYMFDDEAQEDEVAEEDLEDFS
jgi:hypothetical protein